MYTKCIYQADGQLVCVPDARARVKEPFYNEVIYFNKGNYRQIKDNKLTNQEGVNIINVNEYMFISDSSYTYYILLTESGNLELRTYAGDRTIWSSASSYNRRPGTKVKYGKLLPNGKFALYASSSDTATDEYEFWSTGRNGDEGTYTLEITGNGNLQIKHASGTVIWDSYASNPAIQGSGGLVSTTNNNWVEHIFNDAGTFTLTVAREVKIQMVGGGGGGGGNGGGGVGGGGGGGEYKEVTQVFQPGSYSITIGAGGAANQPGGETSVSGQGVRIVANGGGAGGYGSIAGMDRLNGGGGGGGGYANAAGGSGRKPGGTATGGRGINDINTSRLKTHRGGGGAGMVTNGSDGGNGGEGQSITYGGSNRKVLGSGGGGGNTAASFAGNTTASRGGTGAGDGGYNLGSSKYDPTPGNPNSGGGGGGACWDGFGASGGSGFVLISYYRF